jgi:hypothetical protein
LAGIDRRSAPSILPQQQQPQHLPPPSALWPSSTTPRLANLCCGSDANETLKAQVSSTSRHTLREHAYTGPWSRHRYTTAGHSAALTPPGNVESFTPPRGLVPFATTSEAFARCSHSLSLLPTTKSLHCQQDRRGPTRLFPRTQPYHHLHLHHTSATMMSRSGPTLSGLVAMFFVFLLSAPSVLAFTDSYCSPQNTANNAVCECCITPSSRSANTSQTIGISSPMATAQTTAARRSAPTPSPSSSTRTAGART